MSRTFLCFSHLLARRLFSSRPSKFGLSEEEVTELQTAWKVVDASPIPVAKIIFKDLFDKKPEYEKKFTGYDRDRPLLHQNEFIPHLRGVVIALTKVIKKIEDEKEVDRVMDYIAKSHQGAWAAKTEMEDMGQSIKATLKVLNKNRMSSDFDATFDKFWRSFVQDYMSRYEKYKKSISQEPKK